MRAEPPCCRLSARVAVASTQSLKMRSLGLLLLGLSCGLSLGGSGCGGGKPTPDLAGTPDLSIGDLAHPPDLSGDLAMSTIGIACGSTPCAATAQYCCTDDNGTTGSCGNGVAGNCGASVFYCDGPEDCPPFQPSCCVHNGVAQCSSSACGGTADTGYGMCHSDKDCAVVGGSCCGSATSGRYELCLPGGC